MYTDSYIINELVENNYAWIILFAEFKFQIVMEAIGRFTCVFISHAITEASDFPPL